MGTQWEYTVRIVKHLGDLGPMDEPLIDVLNALGRLGWELVSVADLASYGVFYFKRERADQKPQRC